MRRGSRAGDCGWGGGGVGGGGDWGWWQGGCGQRVGWGRGVGVVWWGQWGLGVRGLKFLESALFSG